MSAVDAPLPGSSDRFPIIKVVSIAIITLVIVSPLFLLVVAVDVTHVDANTCQVGPFFVPTAGTARCV